MPSDDRKYYSDSDSDSSSDSDIDDYEEWSKDINPKNIDNAHELDDDFGVKAKSAADFEGDDLFEVDEDSGAQWMAVKPYIGALVAPSDVPRNNPTKPDIDLDMEWVYGYRSYDSRSNLCYNSKKEIIYPTAAVIVAYNPITNKQRYYRGHNDDVICLVQNPADPDIIASGQVATIVDRKATLPHICIHNSVTGEEWILKDAHKRAVRTLGFSADGKYLASVGDDDQQTVTVWDWKKGKKIISEKGDTNKIYEIQWSHVKEDEFVTVGKRHVYFWTFDGKKVKKTRGKLGSFEQQDYPCVGFSEKGYACLGTKDGHIYIFVNGVAKKKFKVHKGAVHTVDWWPGGLVSGGKDGNIVILDKKVKPIQKIQAPKKIQSIYVSGKNLLIGTGNASIYEIKGFTSGKAFLPAPAVSGHFDGEVWSVSFNPEGNTMVSVGEENMVAIWDLTSHRLLTSFPINEKKGKRLKKGAKASTMSKHPPNQCARAVSWSPDGRHIAVGTNSGDLIVYDADSFEKIYTVDLNKHGKRKVTNQKENWIQALKYSPTGKTLAVGTHGMIIALLDVSKKYKVKGILSSHNSPVTHLDWSSDGKHLQTNCRGYELLFHDINEDSLGDSKQNPRPKQTRDCQWVGQSCILGWAVAGVFDPSQDGTDVNIVSVNSDRSVIATGDDYGYVNLFRYPANESGNDRKIFKGHAAHVQHVNFSPNQKYLISAGGNDKTIIQWRVKK